MYNYRVLRQRYKPVIFDNIKAIKKGTWVPLSVAALTSGYSVQMLRLLSFKGSIKTGKFKVGPILVEVNSVLDYREIKKCDLKKWD